MNKDVSCANGIKLAAELKGCGFTLPQAGKLTRN